MDHDGDIPMPINSSYGGHAHVVHHHHDPHIILPLAAPCPPPPPPPPSQTHIHIPSSNGNGNGNGGDEHHHKKAAAATHHHVVGGVRYRECLKNHAAAMGGNATDGCGEFMPSGEEGSIEALTCSACNCHRNFHRKEIEGEPPTDHFYQYRLGRSKVILAAGGHHHPHKTSNMLLPPPPEAFGYPTAAAAAAGGTLVHSRAGGGITSHGGQMIMSYNMQQAVSAESDDQEEEHEDRYGRHHDDRQVGKMKKRFRTKFTQEQKEKMFNFAERVGWKIQKQEEGVVQQLCQELGIKRRVLKVWMHNNKHNLASKNKLPTTAAAADGQLA